MELPSPRERTAASPASNGTPQRPRSGKGPWHSGRAAAGHHGAALARCIHGPRPGKPCERPRLPQSYHQYPRGQTHRPQRGRRAVPLSPSACRRDVAPSWAKQLPPGRRWPQGSPRGRRRAPRRRSERRRGSSRWASALRPWPCSST
ncbi:hypothetical protein BU14_0096s0009 [Porphyra umbilicalis]|uniref:Uncharacterized protein n=1 Tax=Porphyra umbilicalis TaxID=2786 RepID=A0A1X6PDN3_PORUM|nr:hypothetical protein BU14_0096s0009 [Porphyra umbilicalis]|eukprot:OSX78856.1 hypothetical protein BU14_0096s0009 [Porphyra umbilicalis]